MKIGVAKEIKPDEYRVALTTAGVVELVTHGHEVLVEQGAGDGSSMSDDDYRAAGATIVSGRRRVVGRRDGAEGEGAAGRRMAALVGPARFSSPTCIWPRLRH